MTDRQLEDLLILRALEEPIGREELQAAGERSGEVLRELRDDGI